MRRLLYALSGLGFISILIMGNAASGTCGEKASSPLRGTWSFSQFVPATLLLGTPNPIPITAVGTLIMQDDNSFTAHGVFNTPIGAALDLDLNGSCTPRNGNVSNGLDCVLNVPSLNLSEPRFCVVMANSTAALGTGGCFDEFRCVETDTPGTVLLVEYKRQYLGTCN